MTRPVIPSTTILPELTLKAVLLGLFLAAILAVANTFLALKIGVLTASSIPASILSMGVLRYFRKRNLLENNLVQTCASAGEAVAGGIVYTAPALLILHVWAHFPYLQTTAMTLLGGGLGVLFTIPLRRSYMENKELRFPEAQAIAQVLEQSEAKESARSFKHLLQAGVLGGLLELAQNGLKLMSDHVNLWLVRGHVVFGFGLGFSATLLGAGYLMGFAVGASILFGAVAAYLGFMPIFSVLHPVSGAAATAANIIINSDIRYAGIGAMLTAGLLTLIVLIKPFYLSIKESLRSTVRRTERTERDMPFAVVVTGIVICTLLLALLFNNILPLHGLAFATRALCITLACIFVLLVGFIASVICGYFSGLVGVAASPGSSVGIGSILLAALFFAPLLMHFYIPAKFIQAASAFTAILASLVMGAACVANNNSQDLKVGHILGATPYKQQIMLLLGVLVAGLIVPAAMQLLFNVYGIAGVGAHAGVATLPAPPAAAMAGITAAVLAKHMPLQPLLFGAVFIIVLFILQRLVRAKSAVLTSMSLIGVAIGIYLPLSSSVPLFLGSAVAYFAAKNNTRATTVACGLVAGAAIMNVLLAIPFAYLHNPEALAIFAGSPHLVSEGLACVATLFVLRYLHVAR